MRDTVSKWALIAGMAVLLLLAGGWYLLSPADGNPEDNGEPPVRTWHCPKCGLEMPCPPGQEDTETFCPHCIHEKVALEVVTRARGPGAVLPDGPTRMVLGVGAGVLVLLAGALLALDRARKARQARKEEPVHRCRCPGCSRRLRYRQSQAGCTTICPDCNTSLTLPAGNVQTRAPARQQDLAVWHQQLLRELAARKKPPR
jgi:hypothetical protein